MVKKYLSDIWFPKPSTYPGPNPMNGLQACKYYLNKCRPILVQGLQRYVEINFLINNIYGSVAQFSAGELKDPGWIPS